ncbi:MAG: hypothetical protein ACRDTJ_26815 [Pseudonocardiaceae bacterium]
MSTAPAPPGGSSPWASRYAAELRRVLLEHAARAPRTLQQHLGPSELGVPCDRQVAGKMAALPATNHVADPWPSMRGTALHAYAADAFDADNVRSHRLRWVTEQKVTPHPEHPGTADLYDANERAVVDHKFLGASSMQKIRRIVAAMTWQARAAFWPRHYLVQLLLYGLGYYNLGLPVRRVVLAAYPATAASLDGLYVAELEFTDDTGQILPEVLALLSEVFEDTKRRRDQADRLLAGRLLLSDIPATPDSDNCYFCPLYRPEAANNPALTATSCAGTSKPQLA